MDPKLVLKRFCFLGSLESVYVHLRDCVDVKKYLPIVQKLMKDINGTEFSEFICDILEEVSLVRRDEALFLYAAYLSSNDSKSGTDSNMKSKTEIRAAFPGLVRTEEDLFLFCKYAILIRQEQGSKYFSRTVRRAITTWYELKTVDELRTMWMSRTSLHGFSHKTLIKLCHISDETIGSEEVGKSFFKTCTEILKNENISPSSRLTPPSKHLAIAKLHSTNSKKIAMHIMRRYELPYSLVPTHLLRYNVVMEQALPTMTYWQILRCWRKMAFFNHWNLNKKIFAICSKMLSDVEAAKKCRIYPIHILMSMHNIAGDNIKKVPAANKAILKLDYLNELYKNSFDWPIEPGNLRMHITVNLQANYKRKMLKYLKNLNYFDAVLALTLGYCRREAHVDVFHWGSEMPEIHQISLDDNFTTDAAFELFNSIENPVNHQRLADPIKNAVASKKVYDVFLCIVPTAGRGNPKMSSEYLCTYLDLYRSVVNPKAKFIILNLLKLKRSMSYSDTRVENILEICGLDTHTTNIIQSFATHRFE